MFYCRLYLLVLILSFTACSGCKYEKYIKIPSGFSKEYSKQLIKEIDIPIKKKDVGQPRYLSLSYYDGRYIFGVLEKEKNVIDIYDIRAHRFIKEIVIDNVEIRERICGIYVHSFDSIFFCQSSPPSIYLIDSTGNLLDFWNKNDLNVSPSDNRLISKSQIILSSFYPYHQPFYYNGSLFCPIDPKSIYKKYSNIERVGKYNLNRRNWDSFFSNMTGITSKIGFDTYPFDLEQPYILRKDEHILVSYPMDHQVYCYDINSLKLIKRIYCFSKSIESFPEPLSKKDSNNNQKRWNYRIQTPFYGPIFYHAEVRKYTRIVHHPQSLIDGCGNLNRGFSRTSSIIFMDDQLNMVGEELFSNGEIGVFSYIPTRSGLVTISQLDSDQDSVFCFTKELVFH